MINRFEQTEDPIRRHMAAVMIGFLAGLFVGEGKFEEIRDNLDLERWFRLPKSHERRIHGHRHAGVRIVQDGPTLVPALDAHAEHPGPFTANWFRARGEVSSGAVEGLNNKVKLVTRKSYGFRTANVAKLALLHNLGHLPEPKRTHRFC